jgi:hypothetical protein
MDDHVVRLSRRRALLRLAVGAGSAAGIARLRIAGAAPLTAPAAQDTGDQPIPFLFVQSAAAGDFTPDSGATGAFIVTLRSVSDHTLYFADHPGREVGILPTAAFAEEVPFDPADPPNAALVVELDGGERAVAVLELRGLRYEAESHALVYDVAVLAADDWLAPLPALSAAELPVAFRAASLFIDGQGIVVGNLSGRNQSVGIYKVPPH